MVRWRRKSPAVALCCAAIAVLELSCQSPVGTESTDLMPGDPTHDVYLWQRSKNHRVKAALAQQQRHFHRVLFLGGEVSWHHQQPHFSQFDLTAMGQTERPPGVVLRVAVPPRAVPDETMIRYLQKWTRALLQACPVHPIELQIDLDCPSSRLAQYAMWLEPLQETLSVPVIITALPTWLEHSSQFAQLVSSVDGFVLQLHGLATPGAHPHLFSPKQASQAAHRANRFGIPYRLALPTYSYQASYSQTGELIDLRATASAHRHSGVRQQRISADPTVLQHWLQDMGQHPPALLRGYIWFRLPVPGESLNWSPTTLRAVVQNQPLQAVAEVQAVEKSPGLFEVEIKNRGNLDLPMPEVSLNWLSGNKLAAETHEGYTITRAEKTGIVFTATSGALLQPGATANIAWVRLKSAHEVAAQLRSPEKIPDTPGVH